MKVKNIISWLNPLNAKYKTTKQIWPYYAELHKEDKVRHEHVKGTVAGLTSGAASALATSIGLTASNHPELWYLIPASFITLFVSVAYPIVIPSHKKFGENRAATLENIWHAILSIPCDFKMCSLEIRGKMKDELKRLSITKKDK